MAHARTGGRRHALRSLTGLLVVGLVAAVTGGAAAADEAADDAPTTLRVAITQGIDSFNPFLGVFSSSAEMFRAQYDTLVRYGAEDYAPEPGLATEWENSEDGLTWTFTIRDDATFTDGEPVTADDLAFTYNLMMSDPAAAEANGSFVENYASVEAPDDTTLVITTTTPMPEATILANETPIVPEHVWSKVSDIGAFANDDFPLVGSGPFTVTEYRVDEFIRLEANADHWDGGPKVDEVVFRYFKNSDAAVQALRKGDIDLLGDMTAPQFEALEGEADIELHEATGRRFTELTFNPGARTVAGTPIGDGHPALADPDVRYALRHAIDLDTIVERVMNGYAEAGGGYIPPAFSQWSWQPDDETRTDFDLAEAEPAPRRGRLPARRRRSPHDAGRHPTARAATARTLRPRLRDAAGGLHHRVVRGGGHHGLGGDDGLDPPQRPARRRHLRHGLQRLGRQPGPRLHPVDPELRGAARGGRGRRQLRHVLLRPRVRRDVRGAEGGARPGAARRDRA